MGSNEKLKSPSTVCSDVPLLMTVSALLSTLLLLSRPFNHSIIHIIEAIINSPIPSVNRIHANIVVLESFAALGFFFFGLKIHI